MRSLVASLIGTAPGVLAARSAALFANVGTLDQVKARGQLISGAPTRISP
jgi:hypothetical protein